MTFFLPSRKAHGVHHPEEEVASLEKRLYACACDLLIIVFFLYLFHQVRLLILFQLMYFSFFWWKYHGKTVGNYLFNIRVVTREKKPLSFKTAVIRSIGFVLCELIMIGFLWILIDKKKQGWHDKLAKTIVIPTP